jgi:hypothetical protein
VWVPTSAGHLTRIRLDDQVMHIINQDGSGLVLRSRQFSWAGRLTALMTLRCSGVRWLRRRGRRPWLWPLRWSGRGARVSC